MCRGQVCVCIGLYYFQDLESYIAELVPSLAALDGLDSSFSSFYVCTAARKFLFFLDPLRVGRVRIRDVLSCSFLDDLLEVRASLSLPKIIAAVDSNKAMVQIM